MNEVDEFLLQTDTMLQQLALPHLAAEDDPDKAKPEHSQQKLAFCFSNLDASWRESIRKMHVIARILAIFTASAKAESVILPRF